MIVGFTGRAGSGKDTAGAYLVERYGFERRSFAQPLKESAAALLGVTVADLEVWKNDLRASVALFAPDGRPIRDVTVREFLQRYGTEAHRDVFGEDFWVERAMGSLQDGADYVFTDVRFPNEAEAISKLGFNIAIVRDAHANAPAEHPSEQVLDVDYVVGNNDTKQDLYDLLDTIMDDHGREPK